jgi:hypothetical protein
MIKEVVWNLNVDISRMQLENLLLDVAGNLKISDFGLSALSDQVKVLSDKILQKLIPF